MNTALSLAAIAAVCAATALIAINGLRISRTTDDFYVASRTVRPWWNASAIGGEYLSAASFLGVAGLIVLAGQDALWFPIGYTAGYLMLLLFVAAPLRRSGAYTLPDFAQIRLGGRAARTATGALVVVVGWLYIVPQLHGAALALEIAAGAPDWAGSGLVMAVVCVTVLSGGMRSITFVQAFQYWLKVVSLAVPLVFVLLRLGSEGISPTADGAAFGPEPAMVTAFGLYGTISLILALLLGTLGLPHVLVRFYTNPDGPSARRTTVLVVGLLSLFYLFPIAFGILGRTFAADLPGAGTADATVLLVPARVLGGTAGDLLGALVLGGAFASFLSTSSGLVVSVAGVISQGLFHGTVRGFRIATVLSCTVPLLLALASGSNALAGSVGAVFAFTASTLCPLLLLGIWWRGLTSAGAVAGMVTGALACGTALLCAAAFPGLPPLAGELFSRPAAWTVPLAFAVMVGVSRATRARGEEAIDRVMARLHTPER